MLQLPWDTTGQTTGTTLADAITQWSSSGNSELIICIIGTHWKTTGRLLEDPWKIPWKHTGYQHLFLQWHPSVHWGLYPRRTGLLLNYHWLRVGESTFMYPHFVTVPQYQHKRHLGSPVLDRLCYNLFRLNSKPLRVCITGLFGRGMAGGFPQIVPVIRKAFRCHNVM